MSEIFKRVAREWSWKDYLQFFNSTAFCIFGAMILYQAGWRGSRAGYLIGISFLGFGIYRVRYYVYWFIRRMGR
ncbi:MAG TPA: hypothetical protein VN944_07250 [Nitrospiria bacterium]|nr:hypothetical protein [Nitrospiria bacterium]